MSTVSIKIEDSGSDSKSLKRKLFLGMHKGKRVRKSNLSLTVLRRQKIQFLTNNNDICPEVKVEDPKIEEEGPKIKEGPKMKEEGPKIKEEGLKIKEEYIFQQVRQIQEIHYNQLTIEDANQEMQPDVNQQILREDLDQHAQPDASMTIENVNQQMNAEGIHRENVELRLRRIAFNFDVLRASIHDTQEISSEIIQSLLTLGIRWWKLTTQPSPHLH